MDDWPQDGEFDLKIALSEAELSMPGPQGDLWRACVRPFQRPIEVALAGGVSDVQKALAAGADPNARGSWGQTPFMVALSQGAPQSAGILALAAGDCSKSSVDAFGRTAFDWQRLGRLSRLDRRAPLTGDEAADALDWAVLCGWWGDSRRDRLLGLPGMPSDGEWMRQAMMSAASEGRADSARALGARGAPLKPSARWEDGPMRAAARAGRLEALKALAACGADPDERGQAGQSALAAAARGGHWGCVDELLRLGAHIDLRDCHRDTPLMAVAKSGGPMGLAIALGLLERGADPSARRAKRGGVSVEDIAKGSGRLDMAQLLRAWIDKLALESDARLGAPAASAAGRRL